MVKKDKSSNLATQQPSNLSTRPPVVVVLGHIDHGKTTLLDYIRKTRVAAKEAGGITQKIGAYVWESGELGSREARKKGRATPAKGAAPARSSLSPRAHPSESKTGGQGSASGRKQPSSQATRRIIFIDTPGHEAFAKMRGRGAQVADVAVLVVAANDGVMPQTKEAIAHAKAAKIPVVVTLNKIDLKTANLKKVEGQLIKEGLVPEDQGGDVPVVSVSAKTGEGVPELLEMIGLVADLLELKSEPLASLSGVVIESSLSPRQGPLATVIVKEGTLKVGDVIYARDVEGKVKALIDDQGKRIKEALPGTPVEVLGFSRVPPVGSTVSQEKATRVITVPKVAKEVGEGDLNVILRVDTQGSLEAVSIAISGVEVGKRGVNVLLAGVGRVTNSDIYLAQSADGVVLGFNVGAAPSVKKLAEDLGVGTRTFTIIYELLEAVEKLLKGVEELEKAKIKGEGEVIKIFVLHSGDVVLGMRVTAGRIKYRDKVKVMRDSPAGEEEIHRGRVRGLKIKRREVPEVREGQKAGVLIKPQTEFKLGDKIVVI